MEYQFTPGKTWMTDPPFQRRGHALYYYQNDHLGTPQRMMDGAGSVVWEARYEAFGETEIVKESVENHLRFPGQYFDSENGLYHNFHRDYDSELGRYLQSDTVGLIGGVNVYVYAVSNSTVFIDPMGLERIAGSSNQEPLVIFEYSRAIAYSTKAFVHDLKAACKVAACAVDNFALTAPFSQGAEWTVGDYLGEFGEELAKKASSLYSLQGTVECSYKIDQQTLTETAIGFDIEFAVPPALESYGSRRYE